MPHHLRRQLLKIPDFDVLSEEPTVTAQIVTERLHDIGVKKDPLIAHGASRDRRAAGLSFPI